MKEFLKVLKRLRFEFYEILEILMSIVPGTFGKYFRMYFYKFFLNRSGGNLVTGMRIRIQRPWNIIIGKNVHINYGVWIAANEKDEGKICIGNNVLIGPYSIFHSGNHKFENTETPIVNQGYEFNEIIIEDDVWIAARCTILSGVQIGKGSVIAAGSVVTKSIPPFSIVAGVPGKIISRRDGGLT